MIKLSTRVMALALVLATHPACTSRIDRIVPIDIGDECIEPLPADSAEPLFPGMGDRTYPIVTTGPYATNAREYFDQGMNLLYAFNHPEAIHSFPQAAAYDPTAPMPYWGIAMAAGPDINTGATSGCLELAHESIRIAIEKAQRNLRQDTGETVRELRYANALAARYPSAAIDSVDSEARTAYMTAMEGLASAFPDDLDAKTLYAAALMNLAPWQWWRDSASISVPTDTISQAIDLLEGVLKADTNHMGANHYYIHAYEESPTPERALSSATLLPALAPAAGHILHMPSHIYRRTGDHAKATAANYEAVFFDLAYISQASATARYPLHYLSHNLHFLTVSLSMEGREQEALAAAQYLYQNTLDYSSDAYNPIHNQTLVQVKDDYFFTVPIVTAARFHAWDVLSFFEMEESFSQRLISSELPFTKAMWAYANALKYLASPPAMRDSTLMRDSMLVQLEQFWAAVPPDTLYYGNNRASKLFRIANLVLVARAVEALPNDDREFITDVEEKMEDDSTLRQDIAFLRGNTRDERIIGIWSGAVEIEDELYYNEPPDWYYPVRESLGAAYYRQGNYAAADSVFRKDLTINKGNGRSLFGLIESLTMQGTHVPESLRSQFREAWKNATVELSLDTM